MRNLLRTTGSEIPVDHAPAVEELDTRASQLCGIAPVTATTGAADGTVMVGR